MNLKHVDFLKLFEEKPEQLDSLLAVLHEIRPVDEKALKEKENWQRALDKTIAELKGEILTFLVPRRFLLTRTFITHEDDTSAPDRGKNYSVYC